MTSMGSSTSRRGIAFVAALAVAGSIAVVVAQQPPAAGQKPAPPAGQTPAAPAAPAAPGTPAAPAAPAAPAVPTLPAPTKAIVPVAASSVAAKPDQWVGEYVAMTGIVDASVGPLAFTVDQDKTKSGNDVLVLAQRMSDPVAANTYVTVIGLLMKYDPAKVASTSKAHAGGLPADAAAKYSGKPVILATSVVNDRMLDLARFIPPPMTPEEEALQKAMRGVPAASGEMRKGADASNVEMATKNIATLTAAFTEVETFMKKRGKQDAVKWAADARTNVLLVEKSAKSGQWDAAKIAAASVGSSCGTCHTPYRERLEDGSFRFKAGATTSTKTGQ
jgi:cytochrome c556